MKAFRSYFKPADPAPEQAGGSNGSRPPSGERPSQGHKKNRSSASGYKLPPWTLSEAPSTNAPSLAPSQQEQQQRPYGSESSLPRAGNSELHPSSAATPNLLSPQNGSVSNLSSNRSSRPLSALRHSIFPMGDQRNSDSVALNEIRNDMMVNSLHEQQLRKQYANPYELNEGVVLKKSRGSFTCCPAQMATIPNSLYAMVMQMNVRCAMTVNTPVVRSILVSLQRESDFDYVPLPEGLRVQILDTITDLPRAQLHHFAAFIMDTQLLVIWDDEPENLMARADNLEMQLVKMVWSGNDYDESDAPDEKAPPYVATVADVDGLEGQMAKDTRPIMLQSSLLVGVTMALSIACLGLGWRALVLQAWVDGGYLRFALIIVSPLYWFISLFFFQALVGNVFRIFGPIACITANSKCYSGVPPVRLDRNQQAFPHVTIQMPVYKEGLSAVIKPTVISLKAAISTYEMQGGSANIFINDDGMQLISDEDAQARRDFYDEHNIGWVARPAHRPKPKLDEGEKLFLRRGKFKKASNMNYALRVSNLVEQKLGAIERGPKWSHDDETSAYDRCLAEVLREDEGRTWAEGFVRVGDYILIIDSDTRVPKDCLLDAVSEMEQSPEVAIIQFSSGVMNVTTSYFECGVTWFTNLIYSAITFAVAGGDACPFVGHNAMLRWRGIQDAASYEDEDGYEKYWSESHVSEDFDMALRMQAAGYTLRYAAYTGDGFKEGVSLTVYDELARWEKYAYGCNELLFHPFRLWIFKGPFTPLFRRFLFSCIPLPSKLTILAYIGTYYALGAGWILTVVNYFLTGWFWGYFDKFYIDSFAIYISIVVVFTGLGNITLSVLRYRLGQKSLLGSLAENIKWIPMFTIFMGGLSLHLSQALLSHFFEIDMSWGATAKEAEDVNFGQETLRILRRFKFTFVFCFGCTGLMIAGTFAFPWGWQIDAFSSIFPLAMIVACHFALPVFLNPALMMFTW